MGADDDFPKMRDEEREGRKSEDEIFIKTSVALRSLEGGTLPAFTCHSNPMRYKHIIPVFIS